MKHYAHCLNINQSTTQKRILYTNSLQSVTKKENVTFGVPRTYYLKYTICSLDLGTIQYFQDGLAGAFLISFH